MRDSESKLSFGFLQKSHSKRNPTDTSVDGSTPAVSNHEIHHVDEEKRSLHDSDDVEKGPAEPHNGEQTDNTRDPNIVDFDGPDDPENPLNWTKKKKVTATVSIALITLLTYALPYSRTPDRAPRLTISTDLSARQCLRPVCPK